MEIIILKSFLGKLICNSFWRSIRNFGFGALNDPPEI